MIMNLEFKFKNKSVVVVGGSKGIGERICQDFLNAEASVTYLSRNPSESLSDAHHILCDIRDTTQISNAFSQIKNIDFLINVAAINFCKKINEISAYEWDEVMSVNLRSVFLTCKLAIEKMKKNNFGRIINVSSIAGRDKSIVSGVHYTSSKAGIIGFTKQLSYEVAKLGINVNVVCPSQTITDMLLKSMTVLERDALAKRIPVGRLATTKDQSLPILFLCSSAASYISGAAIDVNGGQL